MQFTRGMIIAIALAAGVAALIIVLSLVLAGCASSPSAIEPTTSSAPAPVATTTTTTTPAPPTCQDRITAWNDNGGQANDQAIENDLSTASADASAANLGALQGDGAQLTADSQTALADLPPRCVPGMRADYSAAMHDYVAAGGSMGDGTVPGIQAATIQMEAGDSGHEQLGERLMCQSQFLRSKVHPIGNIPKTVKQGVPVPCELKEPEHLITSELGGKYKIHSAAGVKWISETPDA